MLLLLHWHWDLPGTLDGYKEDVGAAFGDLEEHNCKHQPPTESGFPSKIREPRTVGACMRSAKERDPRQRLALRLEEDIDKPSTKVLKTYKL